MAHDTQVRKLVDALVEIDMALITASACEASTLNEMRDRIASRLRKLRTAPMRVAA